MRTAEVIQRTGATWRQLDHWAASGLVKPSQRAAMGSGSRREYSNAQVEVIALMVDLIHTAHMPPRTAAAVALEVHVTGRSQLTGVLLDVKVAMKS